MVVALLTIESCLSSLHTQCSKNTNILDIEIQMYWTWCAHHKGYKMADYTILVLLWSFFFFSVVEVHCQTYLSLLGKNLSNNSYVDFSLVGHDPSGSDSVQCHTQFQNCCRPGHSEIAGYWFFPDGSSPPFGSDYDVFYRREVQRVDLRKRRDTSVTGMYCCDIPYNFSARKTLCVGLYNNAGE